MKGNVNNTLPELKAFKRAPFLGLSQWENGNLTTKLASQIELNPIKGCCCLQVFFRDEFRQNGPPRWSLKGVSGR